MSARKKAATANPVLYGTLDVPPAAPMAMRLVVRTVAALGNAPRYRAGLGPFGRDPVVVHAAPEQAAAIKADPMLVVADVKGE